MYGADYCISSAGTHCASEAQVPTIKIVKNENKFFISIQGLWFLKYLYTI